MSKYTQPPPNEAIEFLEKLRPGGPWIITAIVPDGDTETITAKDAGAVADFIRANDGHKNLYYSVNPTRTAMTKKAAKTDIAAIEFLLGDLDPNEGESQKTPRPATWRRWKLISPNHRDHRQRQRHTGAAGSWTSRSSCEVPVPPRTRRENQVVFPEKTAKLIADVEARAKPLMEKSGVSPAPRTSTASCGCRAPPTFRTRRSSRRGGSRARPS